MECYGSITARQCREARRRYSRNQSGSFFLREMSRTMSSLRPFGAVSSSRSETKPYLYSCFAICSWITLLETMVRPPVFEKRNVDYNVVIYIFGRACGE